MRTNIEIDDRLMRKAMRSSGARTKRAAVEDGLRLLIRTRGQRSIRRLRGKVTWEGDLNASRLGRVAKQPRRVIVDTTVWIDYIEGVTNRETDWVHAELDRQRLGLTDVIFCEVELAVIHPVPTGAARCRPWKQPDS